tara:strand:+ start:202 stop:1032 length:831 start_codon:yes stop_codon:yes gene_type:complete
MEFEKFKKNIYSQNGEDGIIEEILRRLAKSLDKNFCEFGAWDGIHLSNCYNLIQSQSYKGLFIEGNKKKFIDLKNNLKKTNSIGVNKFVSFDGPNSLDNILEVNNFNINFDVLSIDIDGNDYHVFESLNKFRPKIIIIEFNPTIPNEIEFIQEKNNKINHGSSALSLVKLAQKKKYHLVATTLCNLFFVEENFKSMVIGDKLYSINDLNDDTVFKNYIFQGYDGTIFTSKKIFLNWHKLPLNINQIPSYFREYPDDFNIFKKLLFKVYKSIKRIFN